MKLTRIAVRNLLSFADEDLVLDRGLTVVVGPNGAGKSNLARLVGLAGMALEWLEDRSGGRYQPSRQPFAEGALVDYAAARHRGSAPDELSRLVLGVEFRSAEMEDLACFVRAAVVSSVLTQQSQAGERMSEWAAGQITPQALDPLARGSLVLEHSGSAGGPWDVFYEFEVGNVAYQWALASRRPAGQVIGAVEADAGSVGRDGRSEPVWRVLFGQAGEDQSGRDLPDLPPFSLDLLCRPGGIPVQAPVIQGGSTFSPELEPLRRFAELAGLEPWTQVQSRVYSLAWVLRLLFGRGLVVIGEQFRGVATMTAPLRQAGEYDVSDLAAPVSGSEPYALPLRLLRLKTGGLAERKRYDQVRDLFARLAPGREFDVSLTITPASQSGEPTGGSGDVTALVTVLIVHRDAAGAEWELPVQTCGAGTWEALVLAEALAGADGKVVVLDEPAANLHPGWQRLLRTQIRERTGPAQFVLITHTPYLLPMETEDDLRRLVRAAQHDGAT